MLRGFFLGFIKIHILHHAGQEPVYGVALIQELRRHGYELSPGTLYPILHDLEEAGYLEREDRVVGGKVRKYYSLTAEGRQALIEAKGKIRELVDEVLEGHGPTSLPMPTGEEEVDPGESGTEEGESSPGKDRSQDSWVRGRSNDKPTIAPAG